MNSQTKTHLNTSVQACQNCKGDFIIEPDDFSFYEKMKVPPPTFCPECRLQRRLARRNERVFHYRKCEKCDITIISIFSEVSKAHVYCSPCWWGDDWDAIDYGKNFDSSRPILFQINELFYRVPLMNLYGLYQTKVNSEYTNMSSWVKNCYMVTYSDYCENVTYGSFVNHSKDSIDNLMGNQLELCYETINCNKCYRTAFSVDCESCTDVWFSKNCTGCVNCYGCVNLTNKSYYIFNKPYSKEDYKLKFNELYSGTYKDIAQSKEQFNVLSNGMPQKYMHGLHNVDSTGDYIQNSKNIKYCFVGFNIEDSKFCNFVTGKMTDTYDFVNFGESSSLMYEVLQGGNQCQNLRMCHFAITNCNNLDYCIFCIDCKDCFGCVSLKKHQYCIFNKQYSKEEYFKLREKLIDHMNELPYIDKQGLVYKYGEFFPIEMSIFPYNETTAQEFFPLTKEEAEKRGYLWYEKDKINYKITLRSEVLAQDIDSIEENITNDIIECKHKGICNDQCSIAYKIIPTELQFYKRMNLPLPRYCPNCRHAERIKYRNPLKLWHRSCMCEKLGHNHEGKCQVEFETSYAPDRPEIIYCEKCYQQEVL